MRLRDQLKALDAGATFDEVLNPEQNKARLAAQYSAYKARQANPPRKCCRKSTRQPRPSKRKVPASNVLRGSYFEQEDIRHAATAERLKQVNKGKLDDAPISVYVGGELQMTIGG